MAAEQRHRFLITAALIQDGGARASGAFSPTANMAGGSRTWMGLAAPPALKMAAITMRLPVPRKLVGPSASRGGEKHLVAPGDTITTDTGYMRCGQRWRAGGGGRARAGRPRGLLRRPLSPQGPRHLRGGREAHRLGGWRRGEGEQAGVCQSAEDQVSVATPVQ